MAVDFITMSQLIDQMITIIRDTGGDGAAIETFCQSNYSTSVKVFDNPDGYELPGQDDCPFVCIYRNRMNFGESVNQWIYEIELEIAVNDPAKDTGTTNVVKQTGVRKLEELVNLVYDAVRLNIPCNGNIDGADLDIDETQHPLYIGYLTLRINVPQVIGSVIGL